MHATLTYKDSNMFEGIITILCGCGSIITVIICTFLLLHLVYNVRLTSKIKIAINNISATKSRSSLWSNRMIMAYLLTAILTCSIYGFIRTNVFTFYIVNVKKFTKWQCSIGYFSGFTMVAINRICLYFLYIHRIKSVFENSSYAYSAKTFKKLKWSIFITYFLIACAAIWIFTQNTEFDLYTYKLYRIECIWCGHHSDTENNPLYVQYILIAWYVIIILGEIFINMTFLYMFSYGLYGLQASIMVNHKSLRNALAELELNHVTSNDITPHRQRSATSDDEAITDIDSSVQSNVSPAINNMAPVQSLPSNVSSPSINDMTRDRSNTNRSVMSDTVSIPPIPPKSNSLRPSSSKRSSILSTKRASLHDVMSVYRIQQKQQRGHVRRPSSMDVSIKMLIKLHHLTKKTTILMFIAVFTSIIYWILSAYDGWYTLLIPYDILCNAICG